MRTIIVRTLVAFSLLGTGWAAATAQVSEPSFELVVDAPPGATTITCVRGCRLVGRDAQPANECRNVD